MEERKKFELKDGWIAMEKLPENLDEFEAESVSDIETGHFFWKIRKKGKETIHDQCKGMNYCKNKK